MNSNGYRGKWTHEPQIPGKSKKPDYLLNHNVQKCFFEVKELRKKPDEPTEGIAAWIDPYSGLRTEIDEAREKFKEFKEYSCSLVAFNVDDRQANLDPLFVLGSTLGNLGFATDFDTVEGRTVKGSERNVFLGGGKMINYKRKQPQNTTISAIVVLEEFLDDSETQKAIKEEMKKQSKPLTQEEKVCNHYRDSSKTIIVLMCRGSS